MEDKTKDKSEKKLIESSEGSGKCCGRKGESENSRKEKANVRRIQETKKKYYKYLIIHYHNHLYNF